MQQDMTATDRTITTQLGLNAGFITLCYLLLYCEKLHRKSHSVKDSGYTSVPVKHSLTLMMTVTTERPAMPQLANPEIFCQSRVF